MIIKKNVLVVLLVISSLLIFTGCTSKVGERVNDRFVTDNSEEMPVIPLSEQQYVMALNNISSSLVQDANSLKIQALQIKNSMADRSQEVTKVDTWLNNAQNARDDVYDLLEPDTKKVSKQNLISAIDKYCAELRDYKVLLGQDSIKGSILQSKADQVEIAINNIRNYAK